MPVSYSDIGLQEPSTITNRVAAVTVVRNSTAMQQELLTLADPQTSNALARITDTTPDSTMFGVVVREAVPQSTTVNVSSVAGTVTVAGTVSVSGYVAPSTTVSVANTVSVQPAAGSTWTVHLGAEHQSTAVAPSNSSALNVRVVGGASSAADFPTLSYTADRSGNGIESSTRAVGTNSTMRGVAMRHIVPDSTFVSGQAGSSGDVSLISSVAGQSIYVYAVALNWGGVLTTNTNQLVRLQSGSTGTEHLRWRFIVSAIGAVTQPLALAVTPPAYLFRTTAAANLNLNATSSGATYSVSAWLE